MEPRPEPSARDGQDAPRARADFVGTLVGESTSREFRLAVAREAVREQDLIAVDVELRSPEQEGTTEELRLWAKVQRIERINPLFPVESGHELAETRTNPFDTVLSLSREMVTAVCQVLGAEPREGSGGRLDHVRYPAQPASQAYRPGTEDLQRVVLGDLRANSALDLATLSNRPGVDVQVDGHAIVTRHLAILAMTGAGKSVTARRVVEELAGKHYPIVIFGPHGDYTGLAEVPSLANRVQRFYAEFPLFEEDAEAVAQIVNALGYELTDTMRGRFDDLFAAAQRFYTSDQPRVDFPPEDADDADLDEMQIRVRWLAQVTGRGETFRDFGVRPDLWLVASLAEAAEAVLRLDDNNPARAAHIAHLDSWGWRRFNQYTGTDRRTFEGIKKRTFRAAAALRNMEQVNRRVAGRGGGHTHPLPTDKSALVDDGQISVVSLAGYTGDFQATIYSLIARRIFEARVQDDLALPVLLVLEEAHNFTPARAATTAEAGAIAITKQIAQEGRKFGVGLILISQRPSRLDETTLAMCNSFIIMRMVNPADQRFVRTVVESLGEDDAAMLPDLDVGEAILSGQLINFPVLARIKLPEAQGEREETDAFEALASARTRHHQNRQRQQQRTRRGRS
ncbi:MAG: ATP-binding protein [Bacteroidota bacterium]